MAGSIDKQRLMDAGSRDNNYPGVNDSRRNPLAMEIPFAINALMLTGRLRLNKSVALYPLDFQTKIPIREGIMASDEYFPYKTVRKIHESSTGNHTFLATNGKETLFLRRAKLGGCAPQGIMASKIATLISDKHFAAEQLMDNQMAGSRRLATYAVSVVDESVRPAIETKKFFQVLALLVRCVILLLNGIVIQKI